jgi:hypothetical protein
VRQLLDDQWLIVDQAVRTELSGQVEQEVLVHQRPAERRGLDRSTQRQDLGHVPAPITSTRLARNGRSRRASIVIRPGR